MSVLYYILCKNNIKNFVLRPFLSYRTHTSWVWNKDRKIQFWEESYEQTNDDQTAVERKSNAAKRKAKHGRAFEFDEEV